MRRFTVVSLCILLLVLTLTYAALASTTARAPGDLAQVRGSPPATIVATTSPGVTTAFTGIVVASTSHYVQSTRTARLACSPTPNARTGPMNVAFTPCAPVDLMHDAYPAARPATDITGATYGNSCIFWVHYNHYAELHPSHRAISDIARPGAGNYCTTSAANAIT